LLAVVVEEEEEEALLELEGIRTGTRTEDFLNFFIDPGISG
jgi:hypothetical protein